MKAIH